MTKLYKFTQILDGYTEPYFQMTGTLEETLQRWYGYEEYKCKYLMFLEKQKAYVEIVDKSLYGMGWVNDIYFDTKDDTVTANVFVEPLVLFCKEMLEKYESNTEDEASG